MSAVTAVNNGFWDLPPDDRAAAMQAACDQYGVQDFFDLDPGQRGDAYARAADAWYRGDS